MLEKTNSDSIVLLDGRENISLESSQFEYFELDLDLDYKRKEDRDKLKEKIRVKFKENLEGKAIKFSFSKDYTFDKDQNVTRQKWEWGGWNSFSLESFIQKKADGYFFVIKQSNSKLFHIIYFTRENLEKHLQKKELAANGVYYFYFCKEKNLDIEAIMDGDLSSLCGTWSNRGGDKLVIAENGEITNKNYRLLVPSDDERSVIPFLHVRGFFVGGIDMRILKIGATISSYESKLEDYSNKYRPRLVLGQSIKEYSEKEYYYRD